MVVCDVSSLVSYTVAVTSCFKYSQNAQINPPCVSKAYNLSNLPNSMFTALRL